MHRVIGERSLAESSVDAEAALALYRDIVRARRFDERALALQRRGWMSGYPPFAGQEASQVGAAHALEAADWVFPTYRSTALQIARGVPMSDILLFRRGYAEFDSDHDANVFTQAIPIATQIPHATGVGMAANLVSMREGSATGDARPGSNRDGEVRSTTAGDGEADSGSDGDGKVRSGSDGDREVRSGSDGDREVRSGSDGDGDGSGRADPDQPSPRPFAGADPEHAVLCCFGDGATSEGDFHEGLNFAGVFDAPVVFFCENNGWAISLPRERQTASETIAQKAPAYGFDGVRVDGNDPIAVYETVRDALEAARDGEPVLVESLTYRRGAHTTADDPSRYRDDREDLPAWRTADPVERYERFLAEEGVLDEETIASVRAEADAELEAAVEAASARPAPDPSEIFAHVYAEPDDRLADQQAWLEDFLAEHGDEVRELDY